MIRVWTRSNASGPRWTVPADPMHAGSGLKAAGTKLAMASSTLTVKVPHQALGSIVSPLTDGFWATYVAENSSEASRASRTRATAATIRPASIQHTSTLAHAAGTWPTPLSAADCRTFKSRIAREAMPTKVTTCRSSRRVHAGAAHVPAPKTRNAGHSARVARTVTSSLVRTCCCARTARVSVGFAMQSVCGRCILRRSAGGAA